MQEHQVIPARFLLLKGLKLKPTADLNFLNMKPQPAHYKAANTAVAIYGSQNMVYVMFELNFQGNTKKIFQKLTLEQFRHLFEHCTEKQAFPVRDEATINERIQRVRDYVTKNDQSVDNMEGFVEDSFSILVCE